MIKHMLRFLALYICIFHGSAVLAASDMHAKIMDEFAPIYAQYSPFPLRPIRQSELHQILLAEGYEHSTKTNDYFLQGPRPKDGQRRTEYLVIPKFCNSSDAQDPYVAQASYSARAVRGDKPTRILRALRRSSIISNNANVLDGDGYERLTFTYTGATSPLEFNFEFDVSASQTYNQNIVFVTSMNCP